MMESGTWPHADMPMPLLTEVHRKRQLALGSQLYRLLEIHRGDHKKIYSEREPLESIATWRGFKKEEKDTL